MALDGYCRMDAANTVISGTASPGRSGQQPAARRRRTVQVAEPHRPAARRTGSTDAVDVTQFLSDVYLARAGDFLLRVGGAFLPLGQPAGHAADREQDREHRDREAHRLVDDAGVEVHVRVQLVADEIVVL